MRVVRDGETDPRPRQVDGVAVVLVTIFLVLAGYLIAWGGLWWFLAVPLMFLGVIGMIETIGDNS